MAKQNDVAGRDRSAATGMFARFAARVDALGLGPGIATGFAVIAFGTIFYFYGGLLIGPWLSIGLLITLLISLVVLCLLKRREPFFQGILVVFGVALVLIGASTLFSFSLRLS